MLCDKSSMCMLSLENDTVGDAHVKYLLMLGFMLSAVNIYYGLSVIFFSKILHICTG